MTTTFRLKPVALVLACLIGISLALLPLPIAAGLSLTATIGTLTLIHPAWALFITVLSVPVQELVALPGGLSVTQASLLLGLAALGVHTFAHPERPLRFGRIGSALALFLLTLFCASVFTPYSRSEAFKETLRWATVLLIYLLTLRALPTKAEGRRPKAPTADLRLSSFDFRPGAPAADWPLYGLLACLLLAPAADAVVGLVQFFLGIGPESFGIGNGYMRAYGTIGQPNSFAGYMNQGWPLAVGVALFSLVGLRLGAPRRRTLLVLAGAAVAGGLMLAALLASLSRGSWVGAAAGVLAMTVSCIRLLAPRLRRIAWRMLSLAVAGATLLLLFNGGGLLPDVFARRLASITSNLRIFDVRGVEVTPENFAVVERMAHMQAGWNMFLRYPLTGVGPGNYSLAYEQPPAAGEMPFTTRPWYTSRGHAHNYYLHIAAEAGLVGAGAYLLLLGAIVLQARRALRRATSWLRRGVVVGCIGVVAAVAVHNLFENLHVLNMGLQLGPIWALLALIEPRTENREPERCYTESTRGRLSS